MSHKRNFWNNFKTYYLQNNYLSIKEIFKDILDFTFYLYMRPFHWFNFWRWQGYKKNKGIKNIFMLTWGAVGDMISSSSVIDAVRQEYPDAHITFLGSNSIQHIFSIPSVINEFIDYDEWKKKDFFQLIKMLRKKKFDVGINLKWSSDRAALITLLSRPKFTVGSGPRHWQLFYDLKGKPAYTTKHQIDRHIDIIRAMGISKNNIKPIIYLKQESKILADKFWQENNLREKKVIMVHPGASHITKQWPIDYFYNFVERIIKEFNCYILLAWGNEKEYQSIQFIQNKINDKRILLTPQTKSINILAGLIGLSDLFIGNCSAPMNVAVAMDIPSVIIMGMNNPFVWAPYGEKHRYITSPQRCKKCKTPCTEDYLCQKSITVDNVFNLVQERWQSL